MIESHLLPTPCLFSRKEKIDLMIEATYSMPIFKKRKDRCNDRKLPTLCLFSRKEKIDVMIESHLPCAYLKKKRM